MGSSGSTRMIGPAMASSRMPLPSGASSTLRTTVRLMRHSMTALVAPCASAKRSANLPSFNVAMLPPLSFIFVLPLRQLVLLELVEDVVEVQLLAHHDVALRL